MKTKNNLIFTLAIILGMVFIASCSDDDSSDGPKADKTELMASITEAQALMDDTEEGNQEGQYTEGSKDALQTAITAASSVVDNTAATQTAVDNANVNLQAAITTYEGNLIVPIAGEDLIANWRFDEGSGTVVNDASGNGHDGTFEAGHEAAGGGGVPTWVADRRGDANNALHFTKGGHIVVPAHADFGPSEITISVWVNVDSLNMSGCDAFGDRCANGTFKDNYIVSQNGYKGYKFQTQDDLYPFFTINTGTEGPYIDRAANESIRMKGWYYLAVTFKTNEMRFYIDGEEVTKDVPGDGEVSGSFGAFDRTDFVIGQEVPNADVPSDITWVLSHFEGSIDDLRIYKKALSPTQITSIYNQEKP